MRNNAEKQHNTIARNINMQEQCSPSSISCLPISVLPSFLPSFVGPHFLRFPIERKTQGLLRALISLSSFLAFHFFPSCKRERLEKQKRRTRRTIPASISSSSFYLFITYMYVCISMYNTERSEAMAPPLLVHSHVRLLVLQLTNSSLLLHLIFILILSSIQPSSALICRHGQCKVISQSLHCMDCLINLCIINSLID